MDDHLILTWFPVFNSSLVLYRRPTRPLPKKGTDASWILIRQSWNSKSFAICSFHWKYLTPSSLSLLKLLVNVWDDWKLCFVLKRSWESIPWSLKKWTNTFPLKSWGEKRKRQSRNGRNWFCKRKVPKSQHIQPSSTVLAKYFPVDWAFNFLSIWTEICIYFNW